MSVDETYIANRALQHCGASRIPDGTLRTDDSKNAAEIRACYDSLRRYEQRRNVWRYCVRTVALRPIGNQSKFLTFGSWAIGTTYSINDVVLGSDGQNYSSLVAANIGNDPTTALAKWTLYFGNLLAQEYVTTWSSAATYALGDHAVGSDLQVYISLAAGNINHNPVGDGNVHWSVTVDNVQADSNTYSAGEIVFTGNKIYMSKISGNQDVLPTINWLSFTTEPTVALLNFIYPIGSGPISQSLTANAYRLPNGFLRMAPQSPKAGATSFLGAPSGAAYNDWNFEGNYFTTRDSGVIYFRFAADISDPAQFDAMFIEGFAARLAFAVVEPITQSTAKQEGIAQTYQKVMTDARTVNGIEEGSTFPPEDDYLVCQR